MEHGFLLISVAGRLVREGLRQLLQSHTITIVGETESLVEAQRLLPTLATAANMILCEPSRSPEKEYAAMKQISAEFPDMAIIVLSRDTSQEMLNLARDSGARGFLPNDVSPTALQILLQLALLGENIFAGPHNMKPKLGSTAGAGMSIEHGLKVPLSLKEEEILECLKSGLPNKAIARSLNIAEATVKVHLKSVLKKINAKNRTQAAVWALNPRSEINDRQG
jgi:two-component system nitrate/nitrite response regulator NarL